MAMNRIPGHNIYIGGVFSLRNKAALQRANITHILSVLRLHPVDNTTFTAYQHHMIEVDDVDDENLLEHFPSAVKFIQSGLDAGGSVLVHCAMGKSRSATICIAYLLQRQPTTLTPQSALALLRECRPLCEPNEGFMKQLQLYHEMGCPDDVVNHPLYVRWLYHREVEESVACGRAPELKSVLFEDEQQQRQRHSQPVQESSSRTTEIKCRKCRRTLATTPFIVPHTANTQQHKPGSTSADCAHVFLHPLTWMRPQLFPSESDVRQDSVGPPPPPPPPSSSSSDAGAPLSGRLTCPNPSCGSNIGKFAWQGMQCSCSHWVVPAIGLAKARVDVVDRLNARPGLGHFPSSASLGSMGIRLPPGMRSSTSVSVSANTITSSSASSVINETGPGHRGNL